VIDGNGDEVSDLDEALLHLAQLLLENFAHRIVPSLRARSNPHSSCATLARES
jgi:hypothetical protein